MPSYDATDYRPAAPVAEVTLRNPQTGICVPSVFLLIDSGADVTLLPRGAVDQLGLQIDPNEQIELAGFDGNRSFAQVVMLDLLFLNRAYRGRYLLSDDKHGVLGRDILNHLKLVLDGPQTQWFQGAS